MGTSIARADDGVDNTLSTDWYSIWNLFSDFGMRFAEVFVAEPPHTPIGAAPGTIWYD